MPSADERQSPRVGRIQEQLLAWYEEHRRDLPWRRTSDPYAIWVSEVMLQQTQVATVRDYFERFMRRFPSVEALAKATSDEVLHAWQGLGYYSRARGLLAGARAVVEHHRGRVPDDPALLRALPGVGPYTAGAIASIAFGRPEPIVDGNVTRVLCRVFGLDGDPKRAPLNAELWRIARSLVPANAASSFNQALMELGATLCVPKQPRCELCPIGRDCRALGEGRVSELPALGRRPAVTAVRMVAALIFRSQRVLVVKLPESAPRWAGMWQFPATELGRRESPDAALARVARETAGLEITREALALSVRHPVTRFLITLDAYHCRPKAGRARPGPGRELSWMVPEELEALAMPSAHRRIAVRLTGLSDRGASVRSFGRAQATNEP